MYPARERYFHGDPCKNCAGTRRYASSRSCVECTNRRARERAIQQREARKARTPA